MNISKFEDIWRLMSEFPFAIDLDPVNSDMFCIICNKLMIDACLCVCGCQYCHTCIIDYLKDGDRYCPGGKAKCNEEYICMATDIIRDIRMNNRISKLPMLCPNKSCKSKIELSQMREHLRVCNKQKINCPYTDIGCVKEQETNETIFTHLYTDTLAHSQLLIQFIQILKTEINELKNHFEFEIASLKDEARQKENKIVTLEEELRDVKKRSDATLSKAQKIEIEMEGQREELDNVMNDNKVVIGHVQTQLCDLKKDFNEMKATTNITTDNREREMRNLIKWNKLLPNIDADIVWRINDCTKKLELMRGKYAYSESFYSNNYKLCLRLYIHNNGDNITLHCIIMRGDNDERVQWPMRRAVIISVINQDTLLPDRTDTFKYDTYKYDKSAFDRPINDRNNIGIGAYPFVIYSTIQSNPSIVVNDSIVVSCVISDPLL